MPIFFVVACCFVLLVVVVMSSQIIRSVCVYVVCFFLMFCHIGLVRMDSCLIMKQTLMEIWMCQITSGDASGCRPLLLLLVCCRCLSLKIPKVFFLLSVFDVCFIVHNGYHNHQYLFFCFCFVCLFLVVCSNNIKSRATSSHKY